LASAEASALKQQGYEKLEEFVKTARELCHRMFRNTSFCTNLEIQSHFFGFKRKDQERIDILALKGDKLMYICGRNLFIFKRGKSIMIKPGELLVARNNKAIVISHDDFC
jgi:hypothetical protein